MATTQHILKTIGNLTELAEAHDQLQEGFEAFDLDRLTEGELTRVYHALAEQFGLVSSEWSKILHAMLIAQEGMRERTPGYVIAGTDRMI